jgi:hypothetical protein
MKKIITLEALRDDLEKQEAELMDIYKNLSEEDKMCLPKSVQEYYEIKRTFTIENNYIVMTEE